MREKNRVDERILVHGWRRNTSFFLGSRVEIIFLLLKGGLPRSTHRFMEKAKHWFRTNRWTIKKRWGYKKRLASGKYLYKPTTNSMRNDLNNKKYNNPTHLWEWIIVRAPMLTSQLGIFIPKQSFQSTPSTSFQSMDVFFVQSTRMLIFPP